MTSLFERISGKPSTLSEDDQSREWNGESLDEAMKLLEPEQQAKSVSPGQGRVVVEETEIAQRDDQLEEMYLDRMPLRYINPRELQYQLEDVATACERTWKDRTRRPAVGNMSELKAPHEKLLKALRAAAQAAQEYAEADDERMEKLY